MPLTVAEPLSQLPALLVIHHLRVLAWAGVFCKASELYEVFLEEIMCVTKGPMLRGVWTLCLVLFVGLCNLQCSGEGAQLIEFSFIPEIPIVIEESIEVVQRNPDGTPRVDEEGNTMVRTVAGPWASVRWVMRSKAARDIVVLNMSGTFSAGAAAAEGDSGGATWTANAGFGEQPRAPGSSCDKPAAGAGEGRGEHALPGRDTSDTRSLVAVLGPVINGACDGTYVESVPFYIEGIPATSGGAAGGNEGGNDSGEDDPTRARNFSATRLRGHWVGWVEGPAQDPLLHGGDAAQIAVCGSDPLTPPGSACAIANALTDGQRSDFADLRVMPIKRVTGRIELGFQ